MPKKVVKMVKLQVPAAKATPAPPVGPALGQAGVNIMAFVKEFNARTEKQAGLIIPECDHCIWLRRKMSLFLVDAEVLT